MADLVEGDENSQQPQWARIIASLIVDLARAKPMALGIDDFHLSSEVDRLLLRELARLIDQHNVPLFLAVTLNRESLTLQDQSPLASWLRNFKRHYACVETIGLDPLTPRETKTVTRLFLEARQTTDEIHPTASVDLVNLIAERSCGNPRYIAGLVQHLRREKLLMQTIDGTQFRIDYYRPRARGRTPLFGGSEAVVWEPVWTPGANWATKMSFQKPIEFQGVPIEPGIYFVPAILHTDQFRSQFADQVDFDRAERFLTENGGRGFGGIRIEDDILVTEDGAEVLTAAVPKERAAVEALIGSAV